MKKYNINKLLTAALLVFVVSFSCVFVFVSAAEEKTEE